jgi:adenosine deaminase
MIELHCHLDGSLRWSALTKFLGFDPMDIYFYKGMGLANALNSFETTLGTVQSPDLVRAAVENLCTDLTFGGVYDGEIRFAPQLHFGAPIEDIVDAAQAGLYGNKRLILCGLYGEHPDVLDRLVEVAKTRYKVVGIDLAGAPRDDHRWALMDYSDAFTKAKRYGLGRTVHAGEGRSAKEIEVAINFLHAQRIGHGLTVLDDWKTRDLVLQKDVLIEACLSSNYHTGCIDRYSEHPMKKWMKEGIKFSICTDNMLLSRTDLEQEMYLARKYCGLTHEEINKTQMWAREKLFS